MDSAHLVVIKKDGTEGGIFEITGDLSFGRGAECDIRIKNASVSRLHAKIVVNANDCVLNHLSSTNVTLINDKEITSKYVLGDGDRILIAERIFVYRKGALTSAKSSIPQSTSQHENCRADSLLKLSSDIQSKI